MKPKFIFLFWSTLSFCTLFAQTNFRAIPDSLAEEKVYQIYEVQKLPEFPDGKQHLSKYLKKNLNYPPKAFDDHVQGTVTASFVVEKDGRISNIKIIKGIGSGCDEEVIKLLENMPKWSPGELEGEPVRVRGNIPVVFQLLL